MDVDLLPLPATIADKVALDTATGTIFADRRFAGDPLLLTWIQRVKSSGHTFQIKHADVDEVARLRGEGMRATAVAELDMKVREEALELLCLAAAYGASDVHLMMRGEHTEIQIVVKGALRVLTRKTQDEGAALLRAIYQGIAKTRDQSYNELDFQNAQIPGEAFPPETGLTSVRIVRGPCYPQAQNGAFMTLRLQYGEVKATRRVDLKPLPLPRTPEGEFPLAKMGFTPAQIEKIRTLMDAPNGLIIVTGPTGSGKTTTLFETLKEAARTKPERRLVTVEDPVEYPMPWAVQMAITGARNDSETGAAYGDRIRVALRMAPHLILCGELRGPDVTVSALEASITGHQVWTTLHVTDPFMAVDRIELMDSTRLARKVFCDHKILRGLIAQRLLPQLCSHCSVGISDPSANLPERIRTALSTWGDVSRVRLKGAGCKECGHDGTRGRFAVAEVVVTDADLMRDFITHGSEMARNNFRAKPGSDVSMLESAIKFCLSGLVDPRDVQASVDLIEPKDRRHKP